MSEEYWEGATWVYHADITNDGANSGSHIYLVVPGVGNELEILYGEVDNDDTATRSVFGTIEDDSGNFLYRVIPDAMAATAGTVISFPVTDEVGADAGGASNRLILSGTMAFRVTVAAIAVSQDTAFGIVCRIRGAPPTVTLISPTDAVETVNTNKVF